VLAADEAVTRWIGSSVLARRAAPLEQRCAAARTLEGLHLPPTRLALFAAAIDPERALRDAAMAALVGWDDAAVHRFLVDQLRHEEREPGWIAPRDVRRHFGQVQVALDGEAAQELLEHVRAALLSSDWRRAYRGLQLAPGLPDAAVVPDLIVALRSWIERREQGQGRLRLEGDITRELRRRSGRNIGPHPERWTTWWRSRQAAGEAEGAGQDPAQATTAGFFGLRPLTDRVVFVLDRSGSMDSAFQGSGRTRYEEATEQLIGLLEDLGPQTRFRLILFSGTVEIWNDQLREASKADLGLARGWMRANGPGGATHLQPAVEQALRIDARGRVDLPALEADTVIVLCDGATAEGPGWVRALMEGPNEQACMVFHSVQIGAGGDGTLERLAEESGGDFVRVRG
jgi:Mg-chelatase subunit ChlD